MIPQAILNANRDWDVLGTISIPDVVRLLGDGVLELTVSTPRYPLAVIHLDPTALAPFVQSHHCYKCGRKGYEFVIRRNPRDTKSRWGQWHLTLFTEQGHMMTCDHIIPRSKGGTDDPSNLGTLCRRCNNKKADKPLEQFMKGAKREQAV